ncbi:MAG: ABC transporter substrate-binding protein [Gammaproteobacteria bacterium]|nr:ABC transporter substrate-binding protein [Gammaproteobacteria bacterium]MBT3723672.1 ABC transporter substrate-binding protein [Gammaproteobacteria bacterium]MBT4077535.1 ABC transporter substrate-binding protein [Gammaproteobacteria bacterium]MBT4194133.1 ABC transporter substrate-binding protein [Gammaproteobacteria bacterium]MBT4450675.1 ABC transporter substrate-binding protein [Gammaproteobacteria bacterium]
MAAPVSAAVKIGMITTLTTKAGYLGEDIRDGFKLAIEQGGGKLGNVEVELMVEDDGRKPGKGRQIAERYIKSDKVKIMTGIVFSNVAMAVVPKVVKDDVFYISPNAGPSALAGKGCHENYFNAAWQNDNLHEVMGQYVTDAGFKSAYILAPNYPAGKDALAGFKRFYKGKVVGEVYTKLGQSDYAAELANLRSAKPDAVFFFLPGGMGINFLKQYSQAGLNKTTPVFGPAFSFDARILKAVGDAAVGVHNGSQWNFDLDNSANKQFVSAFKAKYGRMPTLYASQGYDTANLIGSALKATGGEPQNMAAFRKALEKADFDSVRGNFRFGNNHHPVQDLYVREVVKDSTGIHNKTVKKVFSSHQDAYAANCKL